MKPRSGMDAIRMEPVNLLEQTWRIWKGARNLGIVKWHGAIPFRIRVDSKPIRWKR
jgi:hypothetical protein